MNAIQNFAFDGTLVRAVEIEGDPWFVGLDVCRVLNIAKPHQALDRLDDDERGTYSIGTPSAENGRGGGDQSMIVVSEPGVYRLIFTSRKPEAEAFKRWLAHEVLPSIRKTGRYVEGGHLRYEDTLPSSGLPSGMVAARAMLANSIHRILGQAHAAAYLRAEFAGADWLQIAPEPVDPVRDDAFAALDHLRQQKLAPGIMIEDAVRAGLNGDQTHRAPLEVLGLRVAERDAGVYLGRDIMNLYRGTRWAHGRHRKALQSLPGADVPGKDKTVRFNGKNSRVTFLPEALWL